MINTKVKINRQIYFSETTGFGVFKAEICEGSKDTITIVGSLIDIKKNDFLQIEGKEVNHPRFGTQIQIEKYKFTIPTLSIGNINLYFSI